MRPIPALLIAALLSAAITLPKTAFAHEAAGGFILLLPTGFYTLGAALAVAASFLLLAVAPALSPGAGQGTGLPTGVRLPAVPQTPLSLLSTAFVAVLMLSGVAGLDDPLRNPLPFGVWTLGWITLSLACALLGNLWPWVNPWTGLLAVLGLGRRPILHLPRRLGHGIACLQFLLFAWVDLVSPHNMDPEALMLWLGSFWALNLGGMILFGVSGWMARAEPLGLYFRLVGGLAPLAAQDGRLVLHLPGAGATQRPALPPSALAFVLLALASASFDGFASTFLWLGWIGVNPLDFHGRSTVALANTLGLIGGWALLWLLYHAAVMLGCRLAGCGAPRAELRAELAGRLARSLLPISVVFHGAHFLVRLIVDYQYLWALLSDPWGRGWDLFGTAHHRPNLSMFSDPDRVALIWNLQTGLVTLGHVIGIGMAHAIAVSVLGNQRRAVQSQIPLALLMVGYTAFGLWLLATPKI